MKLKNIALASALSLSLATSSAFAVLPTVTLTLLTPLATISAPFFGTGWTVYKKKHGRELMDAKAPAEKYITGLPMNNAEINTLNTAWEILGLEVDEITEVTTYMTITNHCQTGKAVNVEQCVKKYLSIIITQLKCQN